MCNCESRIITLFTATSIWSLWPQKWSFKGKQMVVVRCQASDVRRMFQDFPPEGLKVVVESHWQSMALNSPGCFLLIVALNSSSVTKNESTFTVVPCPTNFATNTPSWSEHTVAILCRKNSQNFNFSITRPRNFSPHFSSPWYCDKHFYCL
jgi:hypothetical protein